MSGAKRSTWVGGTVFVALLIMAASYFLAVSPTLATASDTRAQVQATEQSNQVLQVKLTKLKADFAKLPEYKAELAAIRVQIPTTADLSGYLRQLDAVAVAHSVTFTDVTPSTPQSVVPAVAVAAAPAATPAAPPAATPTATATAEALPEAPSGVPAAEAAPAAAAKIDGFAAIQLVLTVVGTYDNAVAFLNDVQNATPRLFLVTALAGKSQPKADATGGRPATAIGDVELTVTGFAYALTDPSAVPATAAPAAAAPALPGAVAGKNPLIPLGGK
jgi:Tfp pilus assembly protein PilO